MIRLRCETGIRSRDHINWRAPPNVWLMMAHSCARLQTVSLLANRRRRIELWQVQALHNELDLTALYEAGLLELVAWEDHDRTGKLLRIKSADLSEEAARALVVANLLPNALSSILLAPDLLRMEADVGALGPRELEALARWSNYNSLLEENAALSFSDRNILAQQASRSAQSFCYVSDR